MSRSLQVLALAGLCAFSLPAAAETQISAFGGANWNLSSDVKVSGTSLSDGKYEGVDWDGKSFELPPFWGVRATYWLNANWGIAIDYVHAKAAADLSGSLGSTFSRLEFTDGNNILLIDALYRFNPVYGGKVLPYVGAGVGVALPHVEATLVKEGGDNKTYEYQMTGIAAQVLAGLEYKLNEKWSVFGEARFSYSNIVADLDGGGTLKTHLWEPQLAIGLSYRF
jgi:lipid A oxidase